MNCFGYIIDPNETTIYNLTGSINRIKLNFPILKKDVIKISDIYNKDNEYVGDIICINRDAEAQKIIESLLKYLTKHQLRFICLGDAIRDDELRKINNEKIISGINGVLINMLMYMKSFIKKDINDAEIIIAIDEYDKISIETIKFFSEIGNFITVTGHNIPLDEKLYEEIFSQNGLSLNYRRNYKKLSRNWDVFINLSKNTNLENISNISSEGIILDPFFLFNNTKHNKNIINNFGLSCKDIVFFNKFNIINNTYPPQFLESIVRCRADNINDLNIKELLDYEITKGQYSIISDLQ